MLLGEKAGALMFEISNKSRIDPRLDPEVASIESQPGYHVISAQIYAIPAYTFAISCKVSRPRHLNLLEEYVLRVAAELEQPITISELSDLLAVDRRFIERTAQELARGSQAIRSENLPYLRITEQGRDFFTRGLLPQEPMVEEIKLSYQPPFDEYVAIPPADSAEGDESAAMENAIRLLQVGHEPLDTIAQQIDLDLVKDVTAKSGSPLHAPNEGKTLVSILSVSTPIAFAAKWGIYVIRDLVDGFVFMRARNLETDTVPLLESEQIELWLKKHSISLRELIGVEQAEYDRLATLTIGATKDDAAMTETRGFEVERIVQEELRDARAKAAGKEAKPKQVSANIAGTAQLIRDRDIRPAFLEALKQAKKRVLIVSPWVTDEAVDDEMVSVFNELASRRVIILLGWGIARQQGYEERPPSTKLLRTLSTINTPEGLPAVTVRWLGNQHSKDVLIDEKIHLCGSHNWLSYRGDRFPRGESVYQVTIKSEIEQAARYIEKVVSERLADEWNDRRDQYIASNNMASILEHVSSWIAIGRLSHALQNLLEVSWRLHDNFDGVGMLCRAASERLHGCEPSTRVGVLQQIGSAFQLQRSAKLPTSIPNSNMISLSNGLAALMLKVHKQDKGALQTILVEFERQWREIGVLLPDEVVDDFMERMGRDKNRAN
jgi:hypothetical protein